MEYHLSNDAYDGGPYACEGLALSITLHHARTLVNFLIMDMACRFAERNEWSKPRGKAALDRTRAGGRLCFRHDIFVLTPKGESL